MWIYLAIFGVLQVSAIPAPDDLEIVTSDENGLINPEFLIPNLLEVSPADMVPRLYMNITIERSVPEDDLESEEPMDRATTDCGCGYSVINPNPASGRIVNGKETSPVHARPYQVRIQPCFGSKCYLCGATILNKRYILSAMHCIYMSGQTASSVEAVFGEHNIRHDWETKVPHQTISVSNMIQRSDYIGPSNSFDNDIVILKLSRDIQFNDYVVPACLPSSTGTQYYGKSAIVSGWGATSEGGSSPAYLKETTVKVVNDDDSTCRGYNINNKIKMCGYMYGTDSCQGDSGGPLVTMENGRNTVIGVVSYGQGCARPGVAGVYAKVTGYLNWINKNIKSGGCGGGSGTSGGSGGGSTGGGSTGGGGSSGGSTSGPGPACDITCTNIGNPTGNFLINGIPVQCTAGICRATDGSDFCKAVGNPCKKPSGGSGGNSEEGLKCSKPCYLGSTLRNLRWKYLQGQVPRFVDIRINGIGSRCDLSSSKCCMKYVPSADLCSYLGVSG